MLDDLQKAARATLVLAGEPAPQPDAVPEPTGGALRSAARLLLGSQPAPAPTPHRAAPVEAVHIAEPVLETAEKEESAELVTDSPSARAVAWVAGLHAGSWFELAAGEGQPVQRCKLAAIISFSGNHIFVNRSGVKVAEYRSPALQRHFDMGLIQLVDDNQLFDRALESVIGNLRQLQSGKAR